MSTRLALSRRAALLAARALVLYLLSLVAVTAALLSWDPAAIANPARAAGWGLLLAGAALVAESAGTLVFGVADALTRGRIRVFGAALYLAVAVLAPGLLLASASFASAEVRLFAALQALTLLLSASSHGVAGALVNALVLVVFSALAGGAPAALAIVLYLGLLVVFLSLDHCARGLSAHPNTIVPPLRPILRRGARLALPVMLAAAVSLALAPPGPAPRVATLQLELRARRDVTPEASRAHRILLLIASSGILGLVVAVRLFRRGASGQPPTVETLEALALGDEPLAPEPPPTLPRDGGPRGRVVRAYLAFLRDSGQLVARRRIGQTPREFARQVREPRAPLATLTELFMRARWGDLELLESEADAAESAAASVVAALRQPRR